MVWVDARCGLTERMINPVPSFTTSSRPAVLSELKASNKVGAASPSAGNSRLRQLARAHGHERREQYRPSPSPVNLSGAEPGQGKR